MNLALCRCTVVLSCLSEVSSCHATRCAVTCSDTTERLFFYTTVVSIHVSSKENTQPFCYNIKFISELIKINHLLYIHRHDHSKFNFILKIFNISCYEITQFRLLLFKISKYVKKTRTHTLRNRFVLIWKNITVCAFSKYWTIIYTVEFHQFDLSTTILL